MLLIDKPKFKMSINENKREVHIQIIGFVKDHLVPEYLEDLIFVTNQAPKDYLFIVDATEQSPLPFKVSRDLGQTMMAYTTFGFNKIRIVMPKSKISFVQVRNALEEVNFPGEIVNPL